MLVRNIAAAALLLAAAPAAALTPAIGEQVADASFTTVKGQTMTLGDLRGEVVILTYWMSDCERCQKQLNILDYYYRQRRDYGLRVLAIAPEDLSDRQISNAFKGRAIHPLTRIGGDFEPGAVLPTTYIIDRSGQLRHVSSGGLEIEQLNELLVPLLKQPRP